MTKVNCEEKYVFSGSGKVCGSCSFRFGWMKVPSCGSCLVHLYVKQWRVGFMGVGIFQFVLWLSFVDIL